MTQTNTAPIKWAQRSDSLYLTIALPGMFVLPALLLLHESARAERSPRVGFHKSFLTVFSILHFFPTTLLLRCYG
jgi:hypothetical protein